MEPIPSQPHFIRRLPLIDSALKAYENSIVKYGADMIDTYAVGPIYDKLGYSHKSQVRMIITHLLLLILFLEGRRRHHSCNYRPCSNILTRYRSNTQAQKDRRYT